jgi:anti-sigma B factor antagonist
MPAFTQVTRRDGDQIIISVTGDLDLATADSLRQSGLAALSDPACRTLVLDVAAMDFIDSSGLGCWVALHNRSKSLGKQLVISSASQHVVRVLTIGGLASLLTLRPAGDSPASEQAR